MGYSNEMLKEQLSPRELRILGLRAVGLTIKEVARQVDLKPDSVKYTLNKLYGTLGISSELSVGLLTAKAGLADTGELAKRIDIAKFSLLSARQQEVMDALIGENGRTNQQIADCLGLRKAVIAKSYLWFINERLGTAGVLNRVGLGVSYWLYKTGNTNIPRP